MTEKKHFSITDPVTIFSGYLDPTNVIEDNLYNRNIAEAYKYASREFVRFSIKSVLDEDYRSKALQYKNIREVLGLFLTCEGSEDNDFLMILKGGLFASIEAQD